MKDVMILTGAGQIGMAIARRMGYGMKIVVGDKRIENVRTIAGIMNDGGSTRNLWKWIYLPVNLSGI